MKGTAAIAIVVLFATLAGCGSSHRSPPSLAAGEMALPEVVSEMDGRPILCGGGGFVEPVTLHGSPSDPAVTWILFETSRGRENVVWPWGYRARFAPSLEVLDETGRLVAKEGVLIEGGCPMPPDGMLIELPCATTGE
jgi:hypothetical protein